MGYDELLRTLGVLARQGSSPRLGSFSRSTGGTRRGPRSGTVTRSVRWWITLNVNERTASDG